MAGRYQVALKSLRTVDGIVFDSAAEARRYRELKWMERAGEISDIELQPAFVLSETIKHPNLGTIRGKSYRADFRYKRDGVEIIEDVKGYRTDVYKLKLAWLLNKYPDLNFYEVER